MGNDDCYGRISEFFWAEIRKWFSHLQYRSVHGHSCRGDFEAGADPRGADREGLGPRNGRNPFLIHPDTPIDQGLMGNLHVVGLSVGEDALPSGGGGLDGGYEDRANRGHRRG